MRRFDHRPHDASTLRHARRAVAVLGLALTIGAAGLARAADEGSGPADGPVNLNEAPLERLVDLDGIGPTLARRIVDFRTAKPFKRVVELTRVKGIGQATVEELRPHVTVQGAPSSTEPAPAESTPSAVSEDGGQALPEPVNLNTATPDELVRMKGIGATLARRIVDERTLRPFDGIIQLVRVEGIGRETVDSLRRRVRVDRDPRSVEATVGPSEVR